jgi:glycerate kinase
LDRHCVDGDIDATLVIATEAHMDSESINTTTTGAIASESSSAASDDSVLAASTSTTASHPALVLGVYAF